MGLFSSGSKWKKRAQAALKKAQTIEDYQRDVEFQRSLLSNIRQQRIAQAQLAVGSYSTDFQSSTISGYSANIDSTFAGETDYGYGTSQRMEKIQDYQEQYRTYMEKYAKQQKKKAGAFAVAGAVLGAVTGGLGFGAVGALAGASIGQGIGQITSNTGQLETGLNNIIAGASQGYQGYMLDKKLNEAPEFLLTSIDPKTGKEITGSTVKATYRGGRLSVHDFYKY
jgi:hypothetical protein